MAIQRYSDPDPVRVAELIAAEIERGVDGVWLELAHAGEADAGGVVVDSLADLDTALRGVPLGTVPVALDAGGGFLEAAAMLIGVWKARGIGLADARGAFNADPIGAAARGLLSLDALPEHLESLGELASFTARELPNTTAVLISTAPYNAAGATAIQELAAALATGVSYLRAMERAGLPVAQAEGQMIVELPVGCDQFLEIAKLRALRALWHSVLRGAGVDGPGHRLKIAATTAARVLTKRDPWVNMLRTTVGCFAAAVGGADLISVAPFDSAIGLPDELGRRVARNTQVILREESNLARVADPAGGCWYVEKLTEELAQAAWKEFQSIEGRGGMAAVLKDGSLAASIEAVRQQRAQNIAKRKDPITGVSEFPNVKEAPVKRALPNLDTVRASSAARTRASAQAGLDAAQAAFAAAPHGARLDAAIRAASLGASLSSLTTSATRVVNRPALLREWRLASDFEAIRDASDAFLEKTGKRPQVFLANLGSVAHHTARAMYTQNFFEAGGFEVLSNSGFRDAAAAAAALGASGARLAVICSSDTLYESMVPEVAPALKASGLPKLLLAGRPGDREAAYRAAGVDGFIFIGCDVLATLTDLLRAEGVLS